MLTNEEALRRIKQCDECFVVWATDLNAVVAVHPIPSGAGADARSEALNFMLTDYEGPTMGRFFSSSDVSLRTLQDQQTETNRSAERNAIFNAWLNCTIDELIDIVVERRFDEPMDAFQGSAHVVERLYKLHGPRLTETHLDRLERFARSPGVPRDQQSAQRELQCFLAVLRNDPHQLRSFWQRHHTPDIDWSTWTAFTDVVGDLPLADRDVIAQLIEVVEAPLMFGLRYEAMIALGKIGPPSGRHAVDVIKQAIHDSSDRITAVRNRVVARIEAREGEWVRCGQCNRGYVDGVVYNIPAVRPCSECFGLGSLPRLNA